MYFGLFTKLRKLSLICSPLGQGDDEPAEGVVLVQGISNRSDYRNQKAQARMEARQKRS